MATSDNASLVRKMYEALNAGDLDKVASLATPDAKATNIPFRETMGVRQDLEIWLGAFPDGKVEVKSLIAQGDAVVTEIVARGTHTATLRAPTGDIPATGRKVEMQMAEFCRCRDGKIAELRYYFDAFSFLQQLGIGQQQQPAAATGAAGRGTPAAY